MAQNTTLLYDFEWDRDYFMDILMSYHFIMPIVTLLTLHPVIMYLLLFESKSMKTEIRRGFILTHLSLILDEWSFSFLFRIYPLIPYGALYCEGPMCRLGLEKQALTSLLSIPVILINPPFNFLVMRMHQMLVPGNSRWKLSRRTQLLLGLIHTFLMISNVIGFGVFGRDYDRAEELMEEPELAWVAKRGGTIFLFGPPGDLQYFQWELLTFLVSMLIIATPLSIFTGDAMRILGSTSDWTGATVCYIIPLSFLFACMFFDTTSIPGWLFAPLRLILPIIFTLNSHQFGVLFISKNATYRKALLGRLSQLFSCCFKIQEKYSRKHTVLPKISAQEFTLTRALRNQLNQLAQLIPIYSAFRIMKPQKSSVLTKSSSIMELDTHI